MKAFRLAGLLRVRGLQERIAAEDLAHASRAHSATRAREHNLRESMGASRSAATDPASLLAMAASRSANRAMLAELNALLTVQGQAVDEAREVHKSARIDEGGLQKLADAHVERERLREQQAEQAELDEVALRRKKEDR